VILQDPWQKDGMVIRKKVIIKNRPNNFVPYLFTLTQEFRPGVLVRLFCIGVLGYFQKNKEEKSLSFGIQMYFAWTERGTSLESRLTWKEEMVLCAPYGEKFDYPLLMSKNAHHGIGLSRTFANSWEKKPWKFRHLDTNGAYGSFGDIHITPTRTFSSCFRLESSKKKRWL